MNRLLAIVIGVSLAGLGTVALAARDSAGTYTLSPSSPFVTGTPISSSTVNTRFADVASELTDSLSRSGKGGMLAPLRAVDGSVTLPGLSFGSETGSGLYRAGAGDLRLSILGTDRVEVTATGVEVTGDVTADGLVCDTLTAEAAGPVTVSGTVADGASAVGVVLDNSIDLTDAGAKLVSVRSATVEKAHIDKSGIGFFGTGNTISQVGLGTIELTSTTALIDFKDSAAEDTDARIIKAPGANLAVVGTPLTVPTPVADTDAATKGYVDGAILAAGKISGTGSPALATGGFGISAVARVGGAPVGRYQMTVAGATSNSIVIVTPGNNGAIAAGLVLAAGVSGTTVTVDARDGTGTLADVAQFVVTVLRER